ncbi:TOMM precursor leader peptide-binding protein [Colwellia sp. Bg11-28]|uniref:TOMM precursor leader peptide-binding protein n=1 Tax=Colwellia sp. Bg11-28 TaxID=2058305 RepID=UPI000C34421E|nr:TOMM precursor leader peptide-binding protein [Colwellia sp. Bg11-28]PKH85433.1 hypothetical protein CXF79_19410 [Colwellia sp. Bg11-28]
MPYYLHPSVNITEISVHKIQISHVGHEITIEEQNKNIQEFVGQISKNNFPACLKDHKDAEVLDQIFIFFKEHNFITLTEPTRRDALSLDLEILNQISDPDGDTTPPKLFNKVDFSSVNVFGSGEFFNRVCTEFETLKISVNVNPKESEVGSALMVCCSDQPNINLFKEINQIGVKAKLPILFANLNGPKSIIGPFFMPGESSCFTCYTHRLAPNYNFVEEALALQDNIGNIVSSNTSKALYSLESSFHVISQVLKFHNKSFHLCLINEILELDLLDYQLDIRPVLRIPHCKDCYSKENELPNNAVRALI